jgi:hypothetical protein
LAVLSTLVTLDISLAMPDLPPDKLTSSAAEIRLLRNVAHSSAVKSALSVMVVGSSFAVRRSLA